MGPIPYSGRITGLMVKASRALPLVYLPLCQGEEQTEDLLKMPWTMIFGWRIFREK